VVVVVEVVLDVVVAADVAASGASVVSGRVLVGAVVGAVVGEAIVVGGSVSAGAVSSVTGGSVVRMLGESSPARKMINPPTTPTRKTQTLSLHKTQGEPARCQSVACVGLSYPQGSSACG